MRNISFLSGKTRSTRVEGGTRLAEHWHGIGKELPWLALSEIVPRFTISEIRTDKQPAEASGSTSTRANPQGLSRLASAEERQHPCDATAESGGATEAWRTSAFFTLVCAEMDVKILRPQRVEIGVGTLVGTRLFGVETVCTGARLLR
jgi:hypothetical protein